MGRNDNPKALRRRGDQGSHHELERKEWPAPWSQGFGSLFSAGSLGASFARHFAASSGLPHSSRSRTTRSPASVRWRLSSAGISAARCFSPW